jgi:hypothetical protein
MQLVLFGLPLSQTVSLSNEGTTPARFYFVAPPKPRMSVDGQMCWDDNQPISPPWLMIQPDQGEVAPGAWFGLVTVGSCCVVHRSAWLWLVVLG